MVNKMINEGLVQREIAELLLSLKRAVLATQNPEGYIYSSLIAFAATEIYI